MRDSIILCAAATALIWVAGRSVLKKIPGRFYLTLLILLGLAACDEAATNPSAGETAGQHINGPGSARITALPSASGLAKF